jgi:hypothetical protein
MTTRYAHIENNTVVNVIAMEDWALNDYPDWILVQSDTAGIGDDYLNGEFIPNIQPSTTQMIQVTSPEFAKIDTPISLEFSMKFTDDRIDPINETFYIPVIRTSDNTQAEFLTIQFINGVANVSFTINVPGVYMVNISKIKPSTSAILPSNPEIIVT